MATTTAGSSEPRKKELSKECLRELFETGHFADFTIKYHDMEMKVHKSVLDARSPFFRNLGEDDIKDATLAFRFEAPECIELCEESKQWIWLGIKSVIQFCYTGDYPEPTYDELRSNWDRTVLYHLIVSKSAEYLGCDELRQPTATLFARSASYYFNAVKSGSKPIRLLEKLHSPQLPMRPQGYELSISLQRWFMFKEFNHRVQKLKKDNDYKGVCDIMTAVPSAAAEFFQFASEMKRPAAEGLHRMGMH